MPLVTLTVDKPSAGLFKGDKVITRVDTSNPNQRVVIRRLSDGHQPGSPTTLANTEWRSVSISTLSSEIICDGDADGVNYSVPAIVQAKNGDYILCYNNGTYHCLKRSTDKGVTWGPQINQWLGAALDPTLARTPISQDIIVEFGKSNLSHISGAAFSRSSDSGFTWSGFTFFDNPVNATTFTPSLYLTVGTTMFAPAYGPYVANDGTYDCLIWKSEDDGHTWKKISTVRQPGDVDINETSLAHIGPNSLLAISRTGSQTQTLGHISHDNGLTWSSQIDYTSQIGVLALPQLIRVGNVLMLFGRDIILNKLYAFASFDDGQTFGSKTLLETYTRFVDGAYTWPWVQDDGTVYLVYAMQGTTHNNVKGIVLKINIDR